MPANKKESSSEEEKLIKDIVQRDDSMPSAPKNEWNKISRQLHSGKKENTWVWKTGPLLVATMAVLIIIILPKQSRDISSKLSAREIEEIGRYLIDSSLPHEGEQLNFIVFDSL